MPAASGHAVPCCAQVKFVDGRVRGRIRLPFKGWISLAQPSHGWQWAELAPPDEVSSARHSGWAAP